MGRRGPLPKDPEKLLGHRRRAKPKAEPLPAGTPIPEPRAEWLDETKASWRAYWESDLASMALAVDAPSITRLFGMYDQHARAMEVVARALVVKGSTGQIRSNPLADLALRLDASIVRLEGELGLTPAARRRLGIVVRSTPIGAEPESDEQEVPARYAHLRAV